MLDFPEFHHHPTARMKLFDCLQHFQQSNTSDNSPNVQTAAEEADARGSIDDVKMEAENKPDHSTASPSDQPPPPYLHSSTCTPYAPHYMAPSLTLFPLQITLVRGREPNRQS
jgi:hypothetical protein